MQADIILIRSVFIVIFVIAGYLIQPIPESLGRELEIPGGEVAFGDRRRVVGERVIFFELRIRRASLKTLIGAAAGSILGIIGSTLIRFLITAQHWDQPIKSFLTLTLTLFMAYVGLLVGAAKGDYLDLSALGGILSERGTKQSYKILDTSVIIDGRVADIAEAGFMGGTILIPQFVLRELQQIADSSDSAKRNRGRRGLDILQRIQKNSNLDVQIYEADFPNVREVDLKLIELGKQLNAPIVTNDFNLNKVAPARRRSAQHQRAGQRAQACRAARRDNEGLHSQGRQGVQPGRGLSGRRHDGRGRQRAPPDRQKCRHGRDQRPTDHGGQDDLRTRRRPEARSARG